jgi:hypothetical protein
MSGEVARDRDQDVAAGIGVAQFVNLTHARFQHLIGVEARVVAQERECKRSDDRCLDGAKGLAL